MEGLNRVCVFEEQNEFDNKCNHKYLLLKSLMLIYLKVLKSGLKKNLVTLNEFLN